MRKYRDYSDEDIRRIAPTVSSMAQLLKKLGLRMAGGNYVNMQRLLQKLNVDCSHWCGKAWNKDKRLKDWSSYTQVRHLKSHLIRERGHKCESCGLETWMNQKIPLEVDHINGDRSNNELDNLRLLCCNCHALTPTWRNRKG